MFSSFLNILKPEGFTGCYDVCYQAIVWANDVMKDKACDSFALPSC